ncbi:MAG: DUF177 domain-containing protein [Clostridia bacterium]|nr:DUF177 domain-containing protein [Clostridia bacterium]
MKIEVKKLNALKKYTGVFEYDYRPPADICLIPLCSINGSVKVKGSYEIYEDDCVGVNFTVAYRICGQCSYCLNDAVKDIERSFEVLFVPEEDPDNYSYDGNSIDLKTAVNDAILFSQPNVILCREDCTGIDVNN